MDELTLRQQEILDYLRDFQERHGYPPSRREVAGHFRIYPGSVQDHLKALSGGLILSGSRTVPGA